ncbi:MAG: hypothetical protein KKC79_08185, partial [Gammaproteobacteria bacterium]|nr:hypothetical protein [Gammaproteobacteria bacterium]
MSEREQDYAALIARIGDGDAEALKTFYLSTSPRMLSYANRFLRDRESAQEVLQESYLSAWRQASGYSEAISPPVAWLAMIVRSKSLDALRRRKRAPGGAAP